MSFASANRAHADSWVSFPTGVPHGTPESLVEEAEQRDVRVQLVDRDLAGLPHRGRRRRIVRAGGEQHHDAQGREHAKGTRDGDHGFIVATDSVSPMARSRPPSTSAGSSEPGTRPGSRFRVAVVRR